MSPDDVATVDFAEIERWRAAGRPHAFIDVRERGEYALGQIPGGCPLPRGLLEILMERLVPWKHLPVVLYSSGEYRSRRAAMTCLELGYQDVRVLAGGLEAWSAGGREPAYGVNVLGKTFGEALSVTDQVHQVDPGELAGLIEEGVLILDARTKSEYEKGHIPGAVHVPGGEIVPRALRAGLDAQTRKQPIVVHCAGRTRSILGAYVLSQAGLADVHALRNGTMAWVMSGRELESEGRNELPALARVPAAEAAAKADRFAEDFVRGTSARPLTATALRSLLERECVYLVDVRLEEEFEEAHLPVALSCPAGQLANAVDEFLPVRDAHLVCYSSGQTRARIGAALLSRIGYRTVWWLEGGLSAWRDDGLPVETGPPERYLDDLDFLDGATPSMRPEEAARALSAGAVLVDVRRSSEYALCHVPGSVWIPRGDLERRAGKALPKDQFVMVLSDRMLRSALAARTLRDLGYDYAVLDGGLTTWLAEGWPTEEGLKGANVSLQEAKVDAELVAARPNILERSREDMERYLEWEERLGIELSRGQAHQEVTEEDRQP